jgi:hypothetical protein
LSIPFASTSKVTPSSIVEGEGEEGGGIGTGTEPSKFLRNYINILK